MKALTLAVLSVFAAASVFAADAENKESNTVDTSKNVITGTKTTTKKYKKKVKDNNGAAADVEVKEKTKEHKDGKVEKSVDVDAESSNK